MKHTEEDVWEMIWMEKCSSVVVLCDFQEVRTLSLINRKAFKRLAYSIFIRLMNDSRLFIPYFSTLSGNMLSILAT